MKYINLGKAVQWVIKSEIGWRGWADCSHIYHQCIKLSQGGRRREWGHLQELIKGVSKHSWGEPTDWLWFKAWQVGLSAVFTKLFVPSGRRLTLALYEGWGCVDITWCHGYCQFVWACCASQGDLMVPSTLGLPETPGISCDINKHQHTGLKFLGRLKFGTTQSSTKRPFFSSYF